MDPTRDISNVKSLLGVIASHFIETEEVQTTDSLEVGAGLQLSLTTSGINSQCIFKGSFTPLTGSSILLRGRMLHITLLTIN